MHSYQDGGTSTIGTAPICIMTEVTLMSRVCSVTQTMDLAMCSIVQTVPLVG
jgi:hypothetical protein